MRYTLFAVACMAAFVTLPAGLAAQTYPLPGDVESPEALMDAAYDTFRRAPGENINWDRWRSLYSPDAVLIPNVEQTDGEWRIMSTDDFVTWIDGIFAEHSPIGSPQDHGLAEDEIHRTMER